MLSFKNFALVLLYNFFRAFTNWTSTETSLHTNLNSYTAETGFQIFNPMKGGITIKIGKHIRVPEIAPEIKTLIKLQKILFTWTNEKWYPRSKRKRMRTKHLKFNAE